MNRNRILIKNYLICACIGAMIAVIVYSLIHSNATVTYRLGPWAYEAYRLREDQLRYHPEQTMEPGVTVENFEVIEGDVRGSSYNKRINVTFVIEGVLIGYNGERPYSKNVHISERYDHSLGCAIIELTPIMEIKYDNSYRWEPVPYSYRIDYVLSIYNLDESVFNIICGEHEKTVEVRVST
ncbi:MAG: hypothetical protein LBL09_04690 [Oscillospiraceae bacterium]|jgi:hypothetical protein|nr:hypothetical protein [Oscillospiraceae bacterium]